MDIQAEPNVYQTIKRGKRTHLKQAKYRGCLWLAALCLGLMCILQATLNIVLRHFQFEAQLSNINRYKLAVEQLLDKYHTLVEERDQLQIDYKNLQNRGKKMTHSEHKYTSTHSLQYIYTTLTPGTHFPEFTAVGLVDGEQFVYYDSNIRKMIPKTEWIKRIETIIPHFWEKQTQGMWRDEENLKQLLASAMKYFKHAEGLYTLQRTYSCELYTENRVRRYDEFSYNGEDFISLDVRSGTWTAANDEAEIAKDLWESAEAEAKYWKNYLENQCIKWLKMFLSYGRETLERKAPPIASLWLYPEVVCHATGFFPKAIRMSWWKDGDLMHMLPDVHEDEDVELRETLPNQDGTFQKRGILKVPVDDLQNHNYTCMIQHSNLEKDLVLPVSEPRILRDEVPNGSSRVAHISIADPGAILILVAIVCSFAGFVV